jgi:DNA polymerase-3 subunit epsilon
MHAGARADLPATLDDVRFAVVDVETSGLSPRWNHLLQVAVVVARADGTVLERWSSFVRPRWRWLGRVGPTHVHGIRRRDVRNAPDAAAVLIELGRRFDGAVVAAHNLTFDWGFLSRAAARSNAHLPAGPRLCTLELSRSLPTAPDAPRPSHRLADLCRRYDVVLAHAHDARADAEATAEVLAHLLREAGVVTIDDLAQLVVR